MAQIQGINGVQYVRSADPILAQAYNNNNYQYATTSHAIDHDMNPGLIVQPKNDEDIVAVVKYAKANGKAVAIKSGGHQYSGASSTLGDNILLDLKMTFKDQNKDLVLLPDTPDGQSHVFVSVSWSLGEFNGFLKNNKKFVPHGQCTTCELVDTRRLVAMAS